MTPVLAVGETAMSLSVSYVLAVVEIRQIIGRVRQQLDKDSCRIAWGKNIALERLGRVKKRGSVKVQRAPTSACLSPAVFGNVYSKQHFSLVQADRNVNTQ